MSRQGFPETGRRCEKRSYLDLAKQNICELCHCAILSNDVFRLIVLLADQLRVFSTRLGGSPPEDMSTKATSQPRMEHEHTREAIRQRLAAGPPRSYLRDWIYGAIDGIVTTFAIVSGVVGARLASHVILILGTASLVADGFAMAAGDYLATRSEEEEFHHAAAVERRHIEKFPEGEREEVREILRTRGIPSDLLDRIVASITADRNLWIDVMLRDEYGMPDAVRSPWRAAMVTFSAFLVCGLVPLIPFVAGLKNAFWVAAAVTGLMFVLIGALKSRWSIRPWWYSGLTTLAIGGGAAAVAYAIGAWLRGLTG